MTKGYKETFEGDAQVASISVNISHMGICAKTYQIVYCKYVQLLYINYIPIKLLIIEVILVHKNALLACEYMCIYSCTCVCEFVYVNKYTFAV